MKKITYIIALLCVLVTGCSKSKLDLTPYNQEATSVAFATQTDASYAINGMYTGLRSGNGTYFVDGQWNIMADILADNLVLNQVGLQNLRVPFYGYTYSSTNTYGLFSTGYSVIRRANAILENIGSFPDGTFKNDARGEAYAIRALVYFDMCRVYSKTYQNASDADFTLPYVTTTDATNMPASEPLRGFYDKVINDLVLAEGLINASNGVGKMNLAAVQGLLSRVYLYKGDYANCITEATRALGVSPNLPNIAAFPAIWTDATEAGVLFKVKNSSTDNINVQGVNYYQTLPTGIRSNYVVDYSFYQLFAGNDVRKSSYILTSAFLGVSYNHIIKYAGRGGSAAAGVVDGKVLRTAEVLLNRAEANYRNGNTASAVADLVLLKTNRYTGYDAASDSQLTGTALINEILRQRRLELAFEGDRFWDLKRLNLGVHRDAIHGERADGTGTPPGIPDLVTGDYRFNLPYPQGELSFNPKILQNPGY